MKKLILSVAAMTVFAFANAGSTVVPIPQEWYQETTKIDPESLPEKVKEAIQNDLQLKDLKIAEAHQVMEEAQVHYLIKFEPETPGEEIKKKFDAMGKEIVEIEAPVELAEPVKK